MTDTNFTAQTEPDDFESTFNPQAVKKDGVREGSPLEALKAAVQENVKLDDVVCIVRGRPTLSLVLDPNIDGELFQRWQRNSMVGPRRQQNQQSMNAVKFAAVVIANTTKGVLVHVKDDRWQEATDSNGDQMDFKNAEFRDIITNGQPVNSAVDLVRRLFGVDGHMLDVAQRVIDAAGFGDEVDLDENPTEV